MTYSCNLLVYIVWLLLRRHHLERITKLHEGRHTHFSWRCVVDAHLCLDNTWNRGVLYLVVEKGDIALWSMKSCCRNTIPSEWILVICNAGEFWMWCTMLEYFVIDMYAWQYCYNIFLPHYIRVWFAVGSNIQVRPTENCSFVPIFHGQTTERFKFGYIPSSMWTTEANRCVLEDTPRNL